MYLPILQPLKSSEIQISGDVTIDDTAIIAPGVILQAAQGSKIIIRAGVSIGMGAILKAYQGTIEVRENAVIGAGSLILGQGVVGANVGLGASVTIYHASIEQMTVIPAGSLIGDPTRSFNSTSPTERVVIKSTELRTQNYEIGTQNYEIGTQNYEIGTQNREEQSTSNPIERETLPLPNNQQQETSLETELTSQGTKQEAKTTSPWDLEPEETKNTQTELIPQVEQSTPPSSDKTPVVGQVYINKLLVTLFPEKQVK
jgi:carbon dioxide concentrating mechanism protein CcmN